MPQGARAAVFPLDALLAAAGLQEELIDGFHDSSNAQQMSLDDVNPACTVPMVAPAVQSDVRWVQSTALLGMLCSSSTAPCTSVPSDLLIAGQTCLTMQ